MYRKANPGHNITFQNFKRPSTDENDLIAMYRLLGHREREDVFDYVNMKYEKVTGEKESIYSTYFEEKKKQTKSGPIKDNESHTETA